MMNSLPLMNTGPSMVQLILFLASTLLIGFFVARRWQDNNKAQAASRYSTQDMTVTDFPGLNYHSLSQEEGNPLSEAEIYVICGRKRDAQIVLDAAVQEGRLSIEDAIRFWSERKRA